MSRYEKIGNFLLFDKVGEDPFSSDFLAGQIVNYQVQNVFVLKKLDPTLLKFANLIPGLTADYESVKTLANPNIIKPYVLVAENNVFAAVFDHVEGKSLRAVLNKCSQDNFPFGVDHSLLVASRLCTALEYLHSKKVDDERLIHGLVSPESIFVTYDGEIKLQYFGLARRLMKIPESREKFLNGYRNYIAPELKETGHWDKAVDIYGAGTVLYEMLTGAPFTFDGKKGALADILEAAEVSSNSGEKIAMPEDLQKVFIRSLSPDPAHRYPSVADMRKALDLLLFSSEFSPTTFHLAFFMHSLFRDSIDGEAKSLASLRKLDARNFIKDEAPAGAGAQPTQVIERPSSGMAAALAAVGFSKPLSSSAAVLPSADLQPPQTRPDMLARVTTVKEKSRAPIFIGILLLLALGGTLAYVFLFLKPQDVTRLTEKASSLPVPAVQMSPQQQVDDQEKQKLKQEAEKAKEEALKKDEQLKSLLAELEKIKKAQAEASKKKETANAVKAVDPAAIQKLEEEARRLRQEKKQQQALAEQKLKEAQATVAPPVEEVKLQESSPAPEESKIASAGDLPVPAPAGQEQVTPAVIEKEKPQAQVPIVPAINEGDLVELTPDVTKPAIVNRVEPTYPRRAMQKKAQGTVILRILISEKGDPSEVTVLRDPGGAAGFKEAAVAAVKKWKFRPAVKDGKRVKVWMTYPIVFKFQVQ